MLIKRKTSSSFGPDGRRIGGGLIAKKPVVFKRAPPGSGLRGHLVKRQCTNTLHSQSNRLFTSGNVIKVTRAPVLGGLTVSKSDTLFDKKFQRPMTKRRAYDKNAEVALKNCSLGQRKRMDGMAKLLARAGKGLSYTLPSRKMEDRLSGTDEESCSEEEEEKEEEKPFEPLCVWKSPHNGGEARGLPPMLVKEIQADEYGVEEEVTVRRPAPDSAYRKDDQFVPPVLAKWLRPHQREGVAFMYECVMGLRDFDGNGCILADDMGLGKTLQSVALIYTLMKTGITANKESTAKRVIVVCPCSLVKNWDNEFTKWLGPGTVKILALAESDRKTVEKSMDIFVKTKMFNILIVSYETLRSHVGRLNKRKDSCDLLVCDEAHRLKNNDNQTSKALASLPVRRRVLLTGTPMQNDLQEFFAMVDFTNPSVLGTQEQFRREILFPVLRGREPDATPVQKLKMQSVQNDMSALVNLFILRRINTLNAEHLPPKLVQVVCCNLTEIQTNMYQHLISSKDMQHVLDGKQVNCLSSIQMLMKLANHPSLIAEEDESNAKGNRRRTKKISYAEEEKGSAAPGADGVSKYLPSVGGGGRGYNTPVMPEWSGKMFVLFRLMKEMRRPGNGNDKIVIVSNYTQTLDLIGRMCRENSWGFCRLDGSISMKKRQQMVDEFNDPASGLIAFLLSSKAGGCGLNLIGGNRLVLFDPDWNPAVDKQAAARCWRDGQKKRCFTYRFLATGTVEEKIFQRQLSKEGLQSIVDDKDQVNALSSKDLRNLFKLRHDTPSDTHDKLKCERCRIIADNAEHDAKKILPKQLDACQELLERIMTQEDAEEFKSPLRPENYGVSSEEYDKAIKQPIDLGTIQAKLKTYSYKKPSDFSKDVNRIFSNILKVWQPEDSIACIARRFQGFWLTEWTALVPKLINMKLDDDDDKPAKESREESSNENDIGCAYVHNARGEDYQEQIGMPDEENMRHWSHHFSTNTVDDPVFRAAMRGYDNVSFVFGLEVTWSLIQQRQQDEEEKQAMLELENIQKIEEETTNASSSSVDIHENEIPVGNKSDSEISARADTKRDNKPHDDSNQFENDDSSYDSFKDERNENVDAEILSHESSSFEVTNVKNDQSKRSEQNMDKNKWACSECTFLNKNGRTCDMCGAKKSSKV
mmetsp:Transcript_9495/g.13456  ORF Transcript_9495/g.13456 Transcript_9495/m.13456 type:complete len:1151 (+) Transcript_9495:176-3628(+)